MTSTQMPDLPDDEDDDVLLDELPSLGPLDEDDEAGADGLEVALEGAGDAENVGLDDSAGLDDDDRFFELELPTDVATDEEELEAIPAFDDPLADDEYGWTDDGGSTEDERWDPADLEPPSLAPLGLDEDRGEEGADEVFDLDGRDDDAAPHLAALEVDLDADEDEGIDLGLGLPSLIEAALPPRLDGVVVEHLLEEATLDVVVVSGEWWAATAAGVVHEGARCAARGLDGSPTSIAGVIGVVLVGTSAGAFRSTDGAATFTPIEPLGVGPVRLVAESTGVLWARGPTGRLQRSDDGGATWSPPLLLTRVVAMATLDTGIVTLSAAEAARPQIASSEDGGRRWAACDAPPLERAVSRGYALAAAGPHVALASPDDAGGPFLSGDRGRTWVRVPGSPPAHALALGLGETLVLYAAHRSGEANSIVRYIPRDDASGGLLVEDCPHVHRLVALGDRGLLIATDGGLSRVHLGGAR